MEEYFELDGKKYIITNEIEENGNIYYYLSNEDDMYDVMIKKSKKEDLETIYPLEDDKEFDFAVDLLRKKMTEQLNA